MKNTRRAAAAWMTMSLAVSTVLGNTAWGDVLQETGKNRCVHVHTAECYGDADETATMSQTGELEPTECTPCLQRRKRLYTGYRRLGK